MVLVGSRGRSAGLRSCANVLCKRPVACVPGCAPVGPCLEVFPAAERLQVSGPTRPGWEAQGTSMALPKGSGTTTSFRKYRPGQDVTQCAGVFLLQFPPAPNSYFVYFFYSRYSKLMSTFSLTGRSTANCTKTTRRLKPPAVLCGEARGSNSKRTSFRGETRGSQSQAAEGGPAGKRPAGVHPLVGRNDHLFLETCVVRTRHAAAGRQTSMPSPSAAV